MKFIILFVLFFQKDNAQLVIEKKIEKYITVAKTIEDIHKIDIYKNKYPKIFIYYPNINPLNPYSKSSISSNFSMKRLHPLEGKEKVHNGIDIVAKENTLVYAAASGVIAKCEFYNGKAGHSVEIKHKYGFATKYFHLGVFIVKNGEVVKKGQIIGLLGNSGASTGPHLHYEILKNGNHLNPITFLK